MGGHKPLKEHHDDDDEKQQLQHSQTENYSITIWLIILSILIMIGITITGFVLIFIITNSNNINSNSYIDNDIIGTTGNNRILIDPVTGEFDTESMGKTQSSQLQTPLLVIHFTPKSESKSSDEPQPQQQSQHQAEAKRSKRSVTSGYIDGSSSSNPHLTHQSGTIQEARLEPIPATVSTVNFNSPPVTYKPECTRQAITMCSGYLNHNYTVYPNYLGHNNLMEASRSLGKFNSIIKSKCNNRIKQLLCTLLEPPCIDGRSLPPCRRFCRIAVDSCGDHVPTNSDYAGAFDCRRYPDSIDHNVCVDPSAGKKCSSDEFQCPDSSCIPRQWTCDGVQDCLNAADEKNCAGQGHKAKVSLQSIGSGNNMDGVVRKKKLSLNDRRFSSRSDLGLAASQIQSNLYSNKLGFNLPGYNVNNIRTHSLTGPTASNDYFTHREMSLTGSPDYSANGAGFVLPDMQSEATSNRLYDLALAGSMENERKALLESSAHRTQSELSGMESSPSMGDSQISSSSPTESALTRYLKAAAAAEASGSSQSAVSSDENPTSGLVSGSSSMVRRKPLYADRVVEEQHIFDPAVAKHLLKQRESELAANALLESGLTDTTSASESELMSQQLAAMSDFGSSHSSTGSQSLGNSEFLPFSASSPSFSLTPAAMSSLVDSHSFSSSSPLRALSASASLGSLSSLNGHSLMSAASSLPSLISPYALSSLPRGPTGASGVPAGAIVGAPGSQPPPGMKLAGYVTMTNPSPPMMNPSMSASMMNPVGMMGQNPQAQAMAQLMAQSMAQGVKFPFPAFSPTGTTGTGQLGGMMGGQMMNSSPVASASSSSSTSSTSNASPSSSNTATRTRLLSRLNPLNLFRRFRMRNQNSGSSGSTSTPSESNAEAEKRSTVVKEHFKSGHYNHHSSSNRYLLHNNQHPHHQHQQQQQQHHHNHLNYHPSSNYQSPLNGVTQYQSSPSSSISSSSSSSSPSTSSQFYYPQIGSHQNQLGIGSTFHSSSLPLHRQYMSIKRSDLQPEYRLAHLKRSRRETRREVHEDVDDDMKKINDTETAENYYPFAGYTIPLMERIHFRPNRRGSRRLATVGPDQYFSTESQDNIGLMGSGNFEVIRGGILPASSNTRSTATRLAHPKSGSRYQKDEVERNYPASRGRGNKGDERDDDEDEDDSGDDKGMFAPLEDDFFGSDSPGVLGFQGFNHFSGSSIYNVLSASKQKSNVLNDGHTKKSSSSSSSLMSKNNGLLAAASSPPTLSTEIDALPPSILTSDITSSSSSSPSS